MQHNRDSVHYWHENAARTPLLTTAQEITLGRLIQLWQNSEDPSPQVIRRGKKAKDRMIKSNLKLVISVCKKFSKRISHKANLEMVDLYQEGVFGLSRAAEKFDPESGYKFSTYAYWWISQAVRRTVETQLSTIRVPNGAKQIYFRWQYRPEGQTLEQFAKAEGKKVSDVRTYLECYQRAQTCSLDQVVSGKENEASALMDVISTGEPDENSEDCIDILSELHQIPEIKDSLAILELGQEVRPAELASLLDCCTGHVHRKLKDHRANVREHCPNDLRRRLHVKELNPCVKIDRKIDPIDLSPMPETISSNGHKTLEEEVVAAIAEVQESEAPKPTRRKRRTTAEIAEATTISLKINGMDMQGTAADIAAVLRAYAI